MLKIIILAFLVGGAISTSYADIYPNPYLTDPSLATTFASKLRDLNYDDMQKLISSECNQLESFAYLSANNWYEYINHRKTLSESQQYSDMLLAQFPNQQAQLFTFPFGYKTLKMVDDNIQSHISTGSRVSEAVSLHKSYCLYSLAPVKNFDVITNTDYLLKNAKINFLSSDKFFELARKKQDNALIEMVFDPNAVRDVPVKKLAKLNLTKKDMVVLGLLLQDDISKIFTNTNVKWIDYRNFYNEQASRLSDAYEYGGKINKYYLMLLVTVKALELESNDFKGLNIYDPAEISKIFHEEKLKDRMNELLNQIVN